MTQIRLFDKFTERAKKVISLAQEEAQHLQHNALGSEHLLLGLIREEESTAARVLESQGMTLEKVRKMVEAVKGRGQSTVQGELELTEDARTAIDMAVKEADGRFPRTEQPMLGTRYMQESEVAKILQDSKIPPELEELGVTLEIVSKAMEVAKARGNTMVAIQIDTGMAPYAHKPESGEWHHPHFYIDTTSLLSGLLRVPESTAVKVLQALGAPPLEDFWTLVFLEESPALPASSQGYGPQFSPSARRAWSLAHAEARHCNDNYIGGEHVLLGLIAEGSGVAARVLSEMGVSLEKIRNDVRGFSTGDGEQDELKLQPRLQHIIEQAADEARRWKSRTIGTGHLLLVLTQGRDGRGISAGLLQGQGVDLDKMRIAVRQALNESGDVTKPESGTGEEESEEKGLYASIASIEKGLQSRELDLAILTTYPFTIEARYVLEDARSQARQFAQRVGPEHLLLGLVQLTFRHEGLVSQTFKELGINFARARAEVERRSGSAGKAEIVLVQSAHCRACLLLAADEAEKRDGPGASIKSEHLLLGLLREEKGIIADLLSDLGTNAETVRAKLQA